MPLAAETMERGSVSIGRSTAVERARERLIKPCHGGGPEIESISVALDAASSSHCKAPSDATDRVPRSACIDSAELFSACSATLINFLSTQNSLPKRDSANQKLLHETSGSCGLLPMDEKGDSQTVGRGRSGPASKR